MMKDQSGKYYFNNPKIWDYFRRGQIDNVNSLEEEIDFIDECFERYQVKRFLDSGSGSGLHCEMLYQRGYEPVGIDLNKNMVEYARKKYPHILFKKEDMRKIKKDSFKKEFDAVISLCTTFPYNTTNKEVDATLQGFRDVLRPQGIMIIEFFNPIVFLQRFRFKGSFFRDKREKETPFGVKFREKHEIDEEKQLLYEHGEVRNIQDGKLLYKETTVFRLFFPQEIQYIFNNRGFKILAQQSKYELEYNKLDDVRMVTIAQKIGK